jgi:hypothetical protein
MGRAFRPLVHFLLRRISCLNLYVAFGLPSPAMSGVFDVRNSAPALPPQLTRRPMIRLRRKIIEISPTGRATDNTARGRFRPPRAIGPGGMPNYTFNFVDDKETLRRSREEICLHDDEAIKLAHAMNVPGVGNGFDVLRDGNVIYTHRGKHSLLLKRSWRSGTRRPRRMKGESRPWGGEKGDEVP